MTDDLISRNAAIKTLGEEPVVWENTDEYALGLRTQWKADKTAVESLPPAQPESHWIPTTKRLPEDDEWKIVTILDEHGDTPHRYTDFGWYLKTAKCWIVNDEARGDVIAWMPLPESWKGEEDGLF